MFEIFKLSGIYLTFSLISSIVGFIILPIISNYIDAQNFGILATYIVLITGLLPALIGFSLHSIISRSYHTRDDVNSMIFSSYIFSFFITIIVSILLYLFSLNFQMENNWSFNNLIVLIWISYISFIATFNLTFIQLEGKAFLWGITSVVSLIIGVSFTFIFLFYTKLDYWARIYGIGLNTFTSLLITTYYLRKKINIDYSLFKNHFKYYIRLGIPLLFTAISSWLLIYQERFFIEYYLVPQQLGIYSMAFTLASPLMVIAIAISRAWISIGYKYLKNKEYSKYIKISLYCILILFILGIINSFYGKYVYMYIIDDKYYDSFKYIPYFSIIFFIIGIGKFTSPIFLHFEKLNFFTYLNVFSIIISIVFIYIFIEKYKLYTILFTSIVVQLFILLSSLLYIQKKGFLND